MYKTQEYHTQKEANRIISNTKKHRLHNCQ